MYDVLPALQPIPVLKACCVVCLHRLTAVHLACIYIAAKNVEFVPYKKLLSTMLSHVHNQEVDANVAANLELEVSFPLLHQTHGTWSTAGICVLACRGVSVQSSDAGVWQAKCFDAYRCCKPCSGAWARSSGQPPRPEEAWATMAHHADVAGPPPRRQHTPSAAAHEQQPTVPEQQPGTRSAAGGRLAACPKMMK